MYFVVALCLSIPLTNPHHNNSADLKALYTIKKKILYQREVNKPVIKSGHKHKANLTLKANG